MSWLKIEHSDPEHCRLINLDLVFSIEPRTFDHEIFIEATNGAEYRIPCDGEGATKKAYQEIAENITSGERECVVLKITFDSDIDESITQEED